MATKQVHRISDGDIFKQFNGKTSSRKGSKKALKNNIMNKVKSSQTTTPASTGPIESEDEETESSADDEHADSDEDANAFALSNGRQQSAGAAEHLSAGLLSKNEDTMMNDDTQVLAGAEQSLDDDQYADVEDVSDSEISDGDINERDVRRSLENDLIGEFEEVEQRNQANGVTEAVHDMDIHADEACDIAIAQHLSLQDATQHVGFDFEVNMDEDPFVGLTNQDSIYQAMWDEAEMALWRRPGSGSPRDGNAVNNTQKRVRFEEVHDTISRATSPASSEDANEAFPDLFASQDDPTIQRQLAFDVDDENGLLPYDWGDLESCYDFDGEEEDLAFQLDEEDDTEDSEDDSDTSDSEDEGDTTDDECIEEQKARVEVRRAANAQLNGSPVTPAPKRAAVRPSSSQSTSRPGTPKNGKGPQMGTFARDPTRALITNDSVARRTKILPPTNPPEKDRAFWANAKRANYQTSSSRRGSAITAPSPMSDNLPNRPFTARSTLGTMFNGNLDLMRNNEAENNTHRRLPRLPRVLSKAQSSFCAITATEDSEDDYPDVNMQDFLEMSDLESDDERPTSSNMESPSESETLSSSQTMGMVSATPGQLDHFELNRGLVGSFRRNQQHTRHFSSLPSHPAKRASIHEYNALQKGRRGAANTPMTPARKKRASQDLTQASGGVRKSISSPLTSRRPRSRGNPIVTKNPAGLYNTLAQRPF